MYSDLRLLAVAIVLPVIHVLSSAYGETLIRSAGFSKSTVSGHTLQNRVLRRLERVKSPARCLANCLRDPDCVTVNYSPENGICELNSGKKEEFPGDAEDAEYRYYEIDSRSAAQSIQTRPSTTEAPTTEVQTTVPYPVINEDSARWRLFWWYKANTNWPASVTDVLQDNYGDCDVNSDYCFSRLPGFLQESNAEILAIDSAGTIYRWAFDPSNNVAHTIWAAFHDHIMGQIKDGNVWNPKAVIGQSPILNQDSFQYRDEHGVKSLQLDDDNCERDSSLSLGHAMCNANAQFPENVFGVDLLFDSTSISPSPNNGLYIYFRDDE